VGAALADLGVLRAEVLFEDRQGTIKVVLSLRGLALPEVQQSERFEVHAHVGVPRAEGLLADLQRPLQQGFRLGILAGLEVEHPEVEQGGGQVGGLGAGGLLADGEGPLVLAFGLLDVTKGVVDGRQVVEQCGHDLVVLPVDLLSQWEGPLVEGLGLAGLPVEFLDRRERVQALDHVGVLGPESLFTDGEGGPRDRLRLLDLLLAGKVPGEVVKGRRQIRMVLAEGLGRLHGRPEPNLGFCEAPSLVGGPTRLVLGLPVGRLSPRDALSATQAQEDHNPAPRLANHSYLLRAWTARSSVS
jgi:hypothetical protein